MKPTTTSRKEERKEKLRSEILLAASRLFADHGYETVTLRAIADEIGYSHAVLYQHFPDKSHILAELCVETFSLLIKEFDEVSERMEDPVARLFETSRGMMRFCVSHPQHCRIVFFGPENRNGIRAGDYIEQIGQPLFERFVRVFEQAAETGAMPSANSTLAAHTWWCSILGLAMVLIIQGGTPGFSPHDQVIEQSIRMMWSGLHTPDALQQTGSARQPRKKAGTSHGRMSSRPRAT